MTPQKQQLLEELLSGAKDTGLKGKLASFDPAKPYGQRFQIESGGNVFTDGEVCFDNFSLGQQVQIYKGSAVHWIFSSNKLIDKAKLKQSQKQPRRLASEKRSKKPTLVKSYDPKKGYLVTEGSSEYPNCRSITNGAIAIGAIVVRKGNLIDQMRIRPGTPALAGATPGNKIKYLYTGMNAAGDRCLYAAGWRVNFSVLVKNLKGLALVDALIDNLGGDRFLASVVTRSIDDLKKYTAELIDSGVSQWQVVVPLKPRPKGFGFFDTEIEYNFENVSTYSEKRDPNYPSVIGTIYSVVFSSSTQSKNSYSYTIYEARSDVINQSDWIERTDATDFRTGGDLAAGSSNQKQQRDNSAGQIIVFGESQQKAIQFSTYSLDQESSPGVYRIEVSDSYSEFLQLSRWNSSLETSLGLRVNTKNNLNENRQGFPAVITRIQNDRQDEIWLRNDDEVSARITTNLIVADNFANQSFRATTTKDSPEIGIFDGNVKEGQYFYGGAFPANSIILSVNGSRAEANTKALSATKDAGSIDDRSIPLSWAYQPTTANTDILKEGLAQIQGSAYTSARLTHEYTENAVPKTQDVARLAKEAIEIIVPLYDKGFLYQRIDRAKALPPELATITTATGALSFGFLNGSYSP